jgi:phosphate transport system permease protein
MALLVIFLLLAIIYTLIDSSLPAIKTFGLKFFINPNWLPMEDEFGALSFIFGTLITSFLALFIAAPVSILIAIFITEYLPTKISRFLSIIVEMIAAIPSIVFGLWGIFFLVPIVKENVAPFLINNFGFLSVFKGPSFGIGILTASLVLAIMIIPTISSICRSIFELVPGHQKEAAFALGSTKFEMIKISMLLPSISGITSAIILGLGRALGETMAVTMLIGNSPNISASILAPASTMASVMANEYTDANTPLHIASLCYIALVLFFITFFSNFLAKVIINRFVRTSGSLKK